MPPLDHDFFDLLIGSYARLVGRDLVTARQRADWLYHEAPFVVLAHNTECDPRFIYANRAAQARFGYSWDEFIALPSRLSAEPQARADRAAFLTAVGRRGFISDYHGIRIAKSGRRFRIADATVWDLLDADGIRHGQAATFSRWMDI